MLVMMMMVMGMVVVIMMVVVMIMVVVVMVIVMVMMVVMRGHSVRNEMQKCITEKTTGSETQQDLQEGGMFRCISNRNATQDEERCSTDESS